MQKRKTNILFFLPNFDTGGSEKLVVDLVERLDKDLFNVVVCVFFTGFYEKRMKELNIPFYVVHKDGVQSKWASAKFISDIVQKHEIDVVNTHHSSPLIQGVIPFKIMNKTRWIHTEHTRLDLDPNVTPKILFIEKICLKFVDICLGISNGVCDYFENELSVKKEKIAKIFNGIDISKFQFDSDSARKLKARYREEMKIKEDDIVIGLFANFRKQKNHPCLIKAVGQLKSRNVSGFRLVLAGDGPERKNIEQQAKDLKLEEDVLFLGARDDIPQLMNMIDIYCLPSFFEGLPFSLIEATLAGKLVVATDVIGNRDVVMEMGRGTLVSADDSDELASALREVMKTIENKSSQNTEKWMPDEQFTIEGMMKRYQDLFLGENK